MRKTKIIATLGPATYSIQNIRKMIDIGINVLRINMSHEIDSYLLQNIKSV